MLPERVRHVSCSRTCDIVYLPTKSTDYQQRARVLRMQFVWVANTIRYKINTDYSSASPEGASSDWDIRGQDRDSK
jgi:hypothetical protein